MKAFLLALIAMTCVGIITGCTQPAANDSQMMSVPSPSQHTAHSPQTTAATMISPAVGH